MSVIGFGDKFQSPGCRLLVNCARKHHKQAVLNPKKVANFSVQGLLGVVQYKI